MLLFMQDKQETKLEHYTKDSLLEIFSPLFKEQYFYLYFISLCFIST